MVALSPMLLQRAASFLILTILTTVPLLFGAVHPLVQGVYVSLMLVGCGGWLLLPQDYDSTPAKNQVSRSFFWYLVPLLLFGYLVFQSVPLPLPLVELLSPTRADRLAMVSELAGADIGFAALSDGGTTGLYRSFFLFALLFYYLTIVRVCGHNYKFLTSLVVCLAVIGTLEAVYGILQFLKPQLGILWLKLTAGRAAHGTIIYKNQYASMLNMIWPLVLTLGTLHLGGSVGGSRAAIPVFKAKKAQAPLFLGAAALMILAVLFSLSRGGILSMVCVAVALIILLPFPARGKFKFLVVFGVVLTGYVFLLGPAVLFSRFDSIDTSGATRFNIYLQSLPMLRDHWQTGIGLGSYTLLSPIYLKGFPAHIHFDRVHNEYLEILIELGVVVGGVFFLWIGAGMATLLKKLLSPQSPSVADHQLTAIGISACCGLLGFLLHGLVDFGWRLPSNLLYAVTLTAIVIVCVKRIGQNSTHLKEKVYKKDMSSEDAV